MITKSKYNYYFYLLLSSLVVILLYVSNTLSISYKEALNVFVNNSILSIITNFSIYIFGQNDITLRAPFILFYVLSVVLMYKITKDYFRNEKDRLFSIFIFMIIPGVLSASLLVNSAIIVTFCTLLYLYYYQKNSKHSYLLLFLFLFIDNSFAILFLGLFFYGIKQKNNKLIVITLFLFIVSMYIYGFETSGKPKGFLIDTFAIYATIFSPLLFLYFFYSIYTAGVENDRDLTWYISTTALILSLIFSFRQRIFIEDFAPYVVISLPFMLKKFFHSYRIRLKEFRKKHLIVAYLVLIMLFLNVVFTIINKPLYLVLPNSKKHFVYQYHFAKEIASELKKKNINQIISDDEELMLRLKFYKIQRGGNYFITLTNYGHYDDKFVIAYYGKELLTVYIIKI